VMVAWFGWLRSRLATGAPLRHASPLPLAGALIADADGRLLLVHRNTPEMTWWEVPGGKVEAGEDAWQAAQRELEEELSVTVEMIVEVGTEQFHQGELPLQYTWYVAHLRGGAPSLIERDRFDDLRYFTWAEVDALPDASPSVCCLPDRRAESVLDALPGSRRPDFAL
jgi:8-oxo-dGTP diphosphatase